MNAGEDEKSPWLLSMSVIFESSTQGIEGMLYISIPELKFTRSIQIKLKTSFKERVYAGSFEFPFDKVESWWPRGYGKQKLYSVKVRFMKHQNCIMSSSSISC